MCCECHVTCLSVWLTSDPHIKGSMLYCQGDRPKLPIFKPVLHAVSHSFNDVSSTCCLHLSRWTLTVTGVCWPVAGKSRTLTEWHRIDGPAAWRSSDCGARPERGRSNMASAGCLLPSPAQVRLPQISLHKEQLPLTAHVSKHLSSVYHLRSISMHMYSYKYHVSVQSAQLWSKKPVTVGD